MIPTEVESLQDQLTEGSLEVEEFFAILLSTYEFDDSKEEIYSTLYSFKPDLKPNQPILAIPVLSVQMYRDFSISMCSHSLSSVVTFTLKQFLLN